MPVSQSERIANGRSTTHSKAADATGSSTTRTSSPRHLQGITEVQVRAWHRAIKNPSILCHEFHNLEDQFDYPFKQHDAVWVRTKAGNWSPGNVSGRNIRIGQTPRKKDAYYYPVNFGKKRHLRKYFSPLNGEMKPDIEEVRELLRNEGWLDFDSSEDDTMSDDNGSYYSDC